MHVVAWSHKNVLSFHNKLQMRIEYDI
uniref:Uncharacterized protein n=1 Tax=Arundo donax TaxID=35708 RepID=A0A0A8ZY13_ARUDO